MILLSHVGKSRLDTTRYVPATSHMVQSFIGTIEAILLFTMARSIWTVS